MYRTGDIGRWRPDGELVLSGRIDRQLTVRGFRVEPAEIESALASHPDIAQVTVAASGSGADGAGPGGPRLAAKYTLRHPDQPGPPADSLRRFLQERLPRYMVPAEFVALDQPPVPASRAAPEESRTPVQAGLSHLWSRLLRRDRVGLDDDFFALGGNSLLAAEMLAHVRFMFGIGADCVRPLTRGLLRDPTLRGFARAAEQARAGRLPREDGEDGGNGRDRLRPGGRVRRSGWREPTPFGA